MPSVSRAQALLLSHPDVRGSYLDRNNSNQILARIPRIPVRGDSLQVTRIAALATAGFVSSGGAVDASPTTYVGTARKWETRRVGGKVEVAGDIAQSVSMVNDVMQQQIEAKIVAMWNAVGGGGGLNIPHSGRFLLPSPSPSPGEGMGVRLLPSRPPSPSPA